MYNIYTKKKRDEEALQKIKEEKNQQIWKLKRKSML